MAAASLYREYMKLCSVWHADTTRKGKCLGEFIRKRVAEEFRQSEHTVLRDPADCRSTPQEPPGDLVQHPL
uniref:Mitochondrial nucleoid factor 1 n=1 Tax=Ixodes ricinus TaxID=34613 RepID=V5HM90_IXORI